MRLICRSKLNIYTFLLLTLLVTSCKQEPSIPKEQINVTPKKTYSASNMSDPTKTMNDKQLLEYDSLFNESYSVRLNKWKKQQEKNFDCEIVFHTANEGQALCINFINFQDSAVLNFNLDPIIEKISEQEFELIEKPINYIYTRRIMNWQEHSKYELRFSGADYQQYQFRTSVD